MKKLVITQLEIRLAIPPMPYPYFCEEAWEKWTTLKLEKAGFDLHKNIRRYEQFETLNIIFEQDK